MPLHFPIRSDSLFKRPQSIKRFLLSSSSVPYCPTTRTAARHQIPLLATAPLVSLFFFSGFAIAALAFYAFRYTSVQCFRNFYFQFTFPRSYLRPWDFVVVPHVSYLHHDPTCSATIK